MKLENLMGENLELLKENSGVSQSKRGLSKVLKRKKGRSSRDNSKTVTSK